MNRRWICGDVWMDILPSFDHAQLGLKMALLSYRFDVLVDKHFDGKSELTIWREITFRKDKGTKAKLSVLIDDKCVAFPLPDHSLPNKIRFKKLQIYYIDHSVLTFLRSNKPIWDRMGTKFELDMPSFATDKHLQHIWDVLAREIWPIFAKNIRHLGFRNADALNNLRSRTSPTILTDLDELVSIDSGFLFPDGIWLHTPTKNGQPKQLRFRAYVVPPNLEWLNNFKEAFRRATTSVSYTIQLFFHVEPMPIEPFELVNKRTKEKLTLKQEIDEFDVNVYIWLLKRCPIGETATVPAIKWGDSLNPSANLNSIRFDLWNFDKSIGPLSPPTEEEEEEADQSNGNVVC